LPESDLGVLRPCVLQDPAPAFEHAIFLAGTPAQSTSQIGDVAGIATENAIEADLEAVGIQLADGSGLVGGVTGALMAGCDHADRTAAVLIVKGHPSVPDPAAARAVIGAAREPLVAFDIDTSERAEQAEEI
jgi:uncharacterized protein